MDAARSATDSGVPSYCEAKRLPTLVSAQMWKPPSALLKAVMSGMWPGLHSTAAPWSRGSILRLWLPKQYLTSVLRHCFLQSR